MAKNVKFVLNLAGLNELMKSPQMESILEAAGQSVAQAAGAEYGSRVHQASFVAICNVYPDSKKAANENFKENSLLKAIGAVGLPTTKPGG